MYLILILTVYESYIFLSFSRVDELLTSVSTLSLSCSIYQRQILHYVQILVQSQSTQRCVALSTEAVENPACDIDAAKSCMADLAQFFISAKLDKEYLCM